MLENVFIHFRSHYNSRKNLLCNPFEIVFSHETYRYCKYEKNVIEILFSSFRAQDNDNNNDNNRRRCFSWPSSALHSAISSIKAALRTIKTSSVGIMLRDFTFFSHFVKFTGNKYLTGKSYGGISFDSAYNFFPSWKLDAWNSFCIAADAVTKVYKTFINGEAKNEIYIL